jgi:hypothetical protein
MVYIYILVNKGLEKAYIKITEANTQNLQTRQWVKVMPSKPYAIKKCPTSGALPSHNTVNREHISYLSDPYGEPGAHILSIGASTCTSCSRSKSYHHCRAIFREEICKVLVKIHLVHHVTSSTKTPLHYASMTYFQQCSRCNTAPPLASSIHYLLKKWCP